MLALLCLVYTAAASLPVIPGADKTYVGFDVVKGSLNAQPIFAYTFNKNQTWMNPQEPQYVYRVPDQISVVNHPAVSETCTSSTFSSVQSVQQSFMLQFGVGVHAFRMGMGAEASISATARQTFAQQQFFGQANIHVSCFVQALIGNYYSYLDPDFQKAITSLPSSMNTKSEQLAYTNFIRRYGTHYFQDITFGGIATMETQMDNSLTASFTQAQLEAQLTAQFFAISGSFTGFGGGGAVSTHFIQNSQSQLKMNGGNTSLDLPKQWQDWIHTVYYDPIPIKSTITEISYLAGNASQQTNLHKAISMYIDGTAATYCDQDICNGHGKCNKSGECTCDSGWTGENCEIVSNASTSSLTFCFQISNIWMSACNGDSIHCDLSTWTINNGTGTFSAYLIQIMDNVGCCEQAYTQSFYYEIGSQTLVVIDSKLNKYTCSLISPTSYKCSWKSNNSAVFTICGGT